MFLVFNYFIIEYKHNLYPLFQDSILSTQEEDEVDTEKRGIGKRRKRGRGHGSGGTGRGQGRSGRGRAWGQGTGRGEAGAGMSNRTAAGSQLQPEENSAQNLANHDEQLEVRSFSGGKIFLCFI